MAPMRETLDELSSVAAALNKQSDELNSVIDDFDEQLDQAGVGVSVWLGDPLLDESDWSEETNGREDRWEECSGWRLGYMKFHDGWHVAVKRVRLERNREDDEGRRFEPEPGEQIHEVDLALPPLALKSAPRIVRIEAAAHLEALAAEITKRMRRYVDSIAAAKKIVKS